jgi:hypothetical protein
MEAPSKPLARALEAPSKPEVESETESVSESKTETERRNFPKVVSRKPIDPKSYIGGKMPDCGDCRGTGRYQGGYRCNCKEGDKYSDLPILPELAAVG